MTTNFIPKPLRTLFFRRFKHFFVSKMSREFGNIAYEKDIIQELWNISHPDKNPTGSERAIIVAQIINKWQTAAINRSNLAGSNIIPLEGYITKQEHNSLKLREAGYEAWLKFIHPLLDHQKIAKLNEKIDHKAIFKYSIYSH